MTKKDHFNNCDCYFGVTFEVATYG